MNRPACALLVVLAANGCGPSAEEQARIDEATKALAGRWEGGSWKFDLRADGTFEDEHVLSGSAVLAEVATRKGTWRVDRVDGGVARVVLRCRPSDVAGYWVVEGEETNSWVVDFELGPDRVRFRHDSDRSWIELARPAASGS